MSGSGELDNRELFSKPHELCTPGIMGLPTIMDVAAEAGVSMKTASRVLNNEAHVRPHLRNRVLAAVTKLQYRPNLAARQLAASRSRLILLICNSFGASYVTRVLVAAAGQCRQQDYHLVSEPADPQSEPAGAIGRTIERLRPEGVILTPPLADSALVISAIEATGTPLVRISGTLPGYGTCITVDERQAARRLVRHLIAERGHRRIGFIGPRPLHHAAMGRAQGYRDALEEAAIAFEPGLIKQGNFFFRSGFAAAEGLLALDRPPTAIFAANDGMALGAMTAAFAKGLRVPQDLAVAGFDDSPAGRMVWPPLTSVRLPVEALAQRAVRILIDGEASMPEPECELLFRGSTGEKMELSALEYDA